LTVGTSDPFYSLRDVRTTRDVLKAHGFTVQLKELLGQDHNYYDDADEINRDSWAFFKQYKLEDEPRFRDSPARISTGSMPEGRDGR
jgi:hypothetical protein